jgi:2,3-bisphosphoglycerate-independent phosphoglycerate mutase
MPTAPLALIILDGWGYTGRTDGNAIHLAHKPFWDELWQQCPHTFIVPYGQRVGLPKGQMGNSEVGHLNMGAGRIVRMDISRIDHAIETGELATNAVLQTALQKVQQHGTKLHLMGLVSDGGVHSHQQHLYALLQMAQVAGITEVFVHAFTDGRDTAPDSAQRYIAELVAEMKTRKVGQLASICGRYYAMDRDQRWERVQLAYEMMVKGVGRPATDAVTAIHESYAAGITDEFLQPIVLTNHNGQPVATIDDGDSVIFFNFRADRAREITAALTAQDFTGFTRDSVPNIHYVCMTQYDAKFALPTAFPPVRVQQILAEVLAAHNLRNLRLAETEKYAHVTFFFNGGVEKTYPGEERILVPSPKVATYDLQPEMSAAAVTEALCQAIEQGRADVYVVNFANADMVGHTGILPAAIRAVETLDHCLQRIITSLRKVQGKAIITADHGNAEQMLDYETGDPYTAHTTTNSVPFIVVDPEFHGKLRESGALEDVAPTLLAMLGLNPPPEMTGRDLRLTINEI